MALDPLATVADLAGRNIDVSDTALTDTALDVASAAIREAAGCAISSMTATVTVPAPQGNTLPLPGPITAVDSVTIDGADVTDSVLNLVNGLHRDCGWSPRPVPVTVAFTFGLVEVPADIVDLCCVLAATHIEHAKTGSQSTAGLTSVRIDDAGESYSEESAGNVSPVYLPRATREWLASRFGGGAVVVETV